jgi:hypothetical protein
LIRTLKQLEELDLIIADEIDFNCHKCDKRPCRCPDGCSFCLSEECTCKVVTVEDELVFIASPWNDETGLFRMNQLDRRNHGTDNRVSSSIAKTMDKQERRADHEERKQDRKNYEFVARSRKNSNKSKHVTERREQRKICNESYD